MITLDSLSNNFLNQRWATVIGWGVIVLLCLMIIFASINQASALFSQDTAVTPTINKAQPRHTQTTQISTSQIARWQLFGKAEQITTTIQNTHLVLTAIFLSENPRLSTVVIAEKNKPEEVYALGAKLPGGDVLRKIYDDYIILLHNGRLVKMPLYTDKPEADNSNTTQANDLPNQYLLKNKENLEKIRAYYQNRAQKTRTQGSQRDRQPIINRSKN